MGGLLVLCIGARRALTASYGLIAFGSILLIIISDLPLDEGDKEQAKSYISLFFKLAFSSAFNILYCTNFVFPAQMAS